MTKMDEYTSWAQECARESLPVWPVSSYKSGTGVYRTCRRYWAEGREIAGQNTFHVFYGGVYVLRTEDREEAMAVYRLCRRQGEAVLAGEDRNVSE